MLSYFLPEQLCKAYLYLKQKEGENDLCAFNYIFVGKKLIQQTLILD